MRKWFPWLFLGLGLSQAAHSIEEVLTGLWRWMPVVSGRLHEQIAWVPVVQMPEMTFVVANMVIIALMLAFSPIVFLDQRRAWTVATVIAVIETVNGIGHLGMALVLRGYFPGSIAAVGLLAFSLPLWGRMWFFGKEA